MSLPDKAIRDFKAAFQQDCGEEISFEEAKCLGERMIALFSVIYKPIEDERLP
jgi:hypothetical protein